jgi:hypothetical protein
MLELTGVSHVYPNGTRALDDVTLSGTEWCGQIDPDAHHRHAASAD